MRPSARSSSLRAAATLAVATAALALVVPPAAAQRLDLANPDDAVKAMRKIQSTLKDGEPTIFYFYGNVYSRMPGEKDRQLFTYQAFNIRQTQAVSEPDRGYGYKMVSREVVIYLDPKTREVLRRWTNPWTGQEVEVVHVANDPVNGRPMFAQGPRGPYQLGAVFKDGWGTLGIEVPLFYKNPMSAEADYEAFIGGTYQAMEMFGFFFREDELLGPSDSAAVNVSWARVSQWLPWMEMGDRVGYLLFSGYGGKVAGWESLPEVLRQEIETNYPVYKQPPPLDDTRPNDTSWTVFKKHIDRKRASEQAGEKKPESH